MTDTDQPSNSELVDLIKAKATVMLLQPGDVLILSNMDGVTPEHIAERIARLKKDLGVKMIYVFPQDIDVTVLRPSDSTPPNMLNKLASQMRQNSHR